MTAPGGVLDGLDPVTRAALRAIAAGVALDAEVARLERLVAARRAERDALLAAMPFRMRLVPVPVVLVELAGRVLDWCVADLNLPGRPEMLWFVPVRAGERFDLLHAAPVDGLAWRDEGRIAVRVGLPPSRLVEVCAHEAMHVSQPAEMPADEREAQALAYGVRVQLFEGERLLGGVRGN